LLLRGLRTMPLRLERIRRSTPLVMISLLQHPRVEKVRCPPNGFGLITIILRVRERAEVIAFCESLQIIKMAVSWGGYESLVMPRCASIPADDFNLSNEMHRSARLYIGLEEPAEIIADLKDALDRIPEKIVL
jgi:cystathionine beta-lyase/cystathionine gamma-synthase